jgi:hypothetical protein
MPWHEMRERVVEEIVEIVDDLEEVKVVFDDDW